MGVAILIDNKQHLNDKIGLVLKPFLLAIEFR